MLKEPESMEECIYFTRRSIDDGEVMAWVFKEKCTECGKGLMGKPKDEKTGKVKIRAKEYVCPECGHAVPKKEYEESLTVNITYTCPNCRFEGETQIPFKRKKVQRKKEDGKKESVDVLRFQCSKCGENIDITKKLK